MGTVRSPEPPTFGCLPHKAFDPFGGVTCGFFEEGAVRALLIIQSEGITPTHWRSVALLHLLSPRGSPIRGTRCVSWIECPNLRGCHAPVTRLVTEYVHRKLILVRHTKPWRICPGVVRRVLTANHNPMFAWKIRLEIPRRDGTHTPTRRNYSEEGEPANKKNLHHRHGGGRPGPDVPMTLGAKQRDRPLPPEQLVSVLQEG